MNRFCLNIALGLAIILLVGCNGSKKEEPIWKGIKIGELAPAASKSEGGEVQLLKTINFKVYVWEVPDENIGVLDTVWPMLYTKPVQLNDTYAFKANSFSIGVGQMVVWSKIVEQLDAVGAKVAKTVTLLLTSGEPDDLVVETVIEKKDISYISGKGSWEAATIGPGTVALRIKADKMPESRGVCEVEAQPVFSPVKSLPGRPAGEQEKRDDLFFKAVGFKLKMSPGDFFLLGPAQVPKDRTTLGGVFFGGAGTVRSYLLICTDIID